MWKKKIPGDVKIPFPKLPEVWKGKKRSINDKKKKKNFLHEKEVGLCVMIDTVTFPGFPRLCLSSFTAFKNGFKRDIPF